LQVKLELVAASQRQLTEQVVAEPKVSSRVVESDFKLRPRTVEEVRSVNILLDQDREAGGYRTISKLLTLLNRTLYASSRHNGRLFYNNRYFSSPLHD